MKNTILAILLSFVFFVFNNNEATAKDITDMHHLELIETFKVLGDADINDPVLIDGLDVEQGYLLAIIDGDGISIWSTGPLTLTCHGRFKANRAFEDDLTVFLFSLNGFGDSKVARSFYTFTPLSEEDTVELFISDEISDDNRGDVEVGLFKVLNSNVLKKFKKLQGEMKK
jgi:hypothetical protein